MGNFKDVAVIDVLVKPGDAIEVDTPLVTLETEKATMDVPSTAAGVIEKVHVTKGGTVSPGDARRDGARRQARRPPQPAAKPPRRRQARAARRAPRQPRRQRPAPPRGVRSAGSGRSPRAARTDRCGRCGAAPAACRSVSH